MISVRRLSSGDKTMQRPERDGIMDSPTKEVQVDNIIELKHSIQELFVLYRGAHNNKNVMKAVNALRDIVELEADNQDIPLSFYDLDDETFLKMIAKT